MNAHPIIMPDNLVVWSQEREGFLNMCVHLNITNSKFLLMRLIKRQFTPVGFRKSDRVVKHNI